jgi:hypothetical protein
MNKLLTKIETAYAVFKKEATDQATMGNKSAGARSRKASMELRNMLKEWRSVSVEGK